MANVVVHEEWDLTDRSLIGYLLGLRLQYPKWYMAYPDHGERLFTAIVPGIESEFLLIIRSVETDQLIAGIFPEDPGHVTVFDKSIQREITQIVWQFPEKKNILVSVRK
jgi:hypothetical protein